MSRGLCIYIFFSKSFFWVILFRPFSPLPPTPPSALYPFLPLQVLAHALISLSFRRNKYYCLYLSLLVLPITVFYFDLKSNVEITYIHIYIYIFMLYQDRTEAYVWPPMLGLCHAISLPPFDPPPPSPHALCHPPPPLPHEGPFELKVRHIFQRCIKRVKVRRGQRLRGWRRVWGRPGNLVFSLPLVLHCPPPPLPSSPLVQLEDGQKASELVVI